MLLVVALLMATACHSSTQTSEEARQARQTINDVTIVSEIRARLARDRPFNYARVDVDADRGIVALRGVVSSAEQRERAEELGRTVEGVRQINNLLRVHPAPIHTDEGSRQ
jgi:hyperosmotically inducible protein